MRPLTSLFRKFRRLFWDIETSPNVGWFWRAGPKQWIGNEAILKERKIICIAYKWEGEKKVTVLRWDKNQDDRAMLVEFLEVAHEADEMVAHHGDAFDLPWFRTRCLFHGLQPLPKYKTIDTCAWAQRLCYFNSSKLDYIAQVLGVGRKIHTSINLWIDVVFGHCAKALRKMCRYCGHDVVVLEGVFQKLRVIADPKTHVGVLEGGEKWSCAHCGSTDVRKDKTRVTAQGTIQHQMRCKNPKCNGYYTISDPVFKQFNRERKHEEASHQGLRKKA